MKLHQQLEKWNQEGFKLTEMLRKVDEGRIFYAYIVVNPNQHYKGVLCLHTDMNNEVCGIESRNKCEYWYSYFERFYNDRTIKPEELEGIYIDANGNTRRPPLIAGRPTVRRPTVYHD